MKKLLVILLILSIIISGCRYTPERTYQNSVSTNQIITIHQLKETNPTSGNFNVEGYVVKIYTCPPCPKGAFCKPCMPSNIVISENNKLLKTYSLTDFELMIFSNDPKQFELGKKYIFSIKILDYPAGDSVNGNIELIGYDLLE